MCVCVYIYIYMYVHIECRPKSIDKIELCSTESGELSFTTRKSTMTTTVAIHK